MHEKIYTLEDMLKAEKKVKESLEQRFFIAAFIPAALINYIDGNISAFSETILGTFTNFFLGIIVCQFCIFGICLLVLNFLENYLRNEFWDNNKKSFLAYLIITSVLSIIGVLITCF